MDPKFAIDPKWMDAYSRRQAGQAGKLVMDDWNKARQALGLDLIGGSYKQATGVAPPYDLQKAFAMMTRKHRRRPVHASFLCSPLSAAAALARSPCSVITNAST